MNPRPPRRFLVAAVAVPLTLALLHHGVGHMGDLRFFHGWYLAFREGAAFYRDGPGVNYPILGALLVCAPSRLLDLVVGGPLSFGAFLWVHKLTLAASETALLLAARDLARTLGSRTPERAASIVYALPVVWLGGGYFGQTDAASTAALLFAASRLCRFARDGRSDELAFGLGAAHVAFLLKQLAWFSLPALAALTVAGLLTHGGRRRVAIVTLSPVLWFVVDPLLVLPDAHVSHLVYLATRSVRDHGTLLVANGASVWAFVPPPLPSANEPLLLGLDGSAIGAIAWLLTLGASAWRLAQRGTRPRDLVRLAGLGQLAMACLMTGVHERYLAHAVPLLVLVELDARLPRRLLGIAVGVLAAGPLLASVHHSMGALGSPHLLALLSLLWLGLTLGRPSMEPLEMRAIAARAGLVLAATLVALVCGELAVRALSLSPSRYTSPRSLESEDKRLALDLYPDDPRGALPIDLGDAAQRRAWARRLPASREHAERTPHGVALEFDESLCRQPPTGRGEGRRVLAIGDSFTEGQGVAAERTFAARLDRALPEVSVRNCGRRGYDFPTLHERFDALMDEGAYDAVLYAMVLNDPERTEAFAAQQRFIDDWILDRRRMLSEAPSGPPSWPPRLWQLLGDRLEGWQVQRETTAWYREMVGQGSNAEGWARTLAHIEAMSRRAEGRLLVALWPLLVGLDGDYPFTETHQTIRRALTERGVAVVDTRGAFMGAAPASLWVHPADRHPNAEAHARFARRVEAPLRALIEAPR